MAGHVTGAVATRVAMCMHELQRLGEEDFGAACTLDSIKNAMAILKRESCAALKSRACSVSVLLRELLKISRLIFELQSAFTPTTLDDTTSSSTATHKTATFSQLGLFPSIILEVLSLDESVEQLQADPLAIDCLLSSLDVPIVCLRSLRHIQNNFSGVDFMADLGGSFTAAVENSFHAVQCAFELSLLMPGLPETCQESVHYLLSTTLSDDILAEGASLSTAILHSSMIEGKLPAGQIEIYSAYLDILSSFTTAACVSSVSETFWARKMNWKVVSLLLFEILRHLAQGSQEEREREVALMDKMFTIFISLSTIDIESAAWHECVDFAEFWGSRETVYQLLEMCASLRNATAEIDDVSNAGDGDAGRLRLRLATLRVATVAPALCCLSAASLAISHRRSFNATSVRACLSAIADGWMLSSAADAAAIASIASAPTEHNKIAALLSSCFARLAASVKLAFSTQQEQQQQLQQQQQQPPQPQENASACLMELTLLLHAAHLVSEIQVAGVPWGYENIAAGGLLVPVSGLDLSFALADAAHKMSLRHTLNNEDAFCAALEAALMACKCALARSHLPYFEWLRFYGDGGEGGNGGGGDADSVATTESEQGVLLSPQEKASVLIRTCLGSIQLHLMTAMKILPGLPQILTPEGFLSHPQKLMVSCLLTILHTLSAYAPWMDHLKEADVEHFAAAVVTYRSLLQAVMLAPEPGISFLKDTLSRSPQHPFNVDILDGTLTVVDVLNHLTVLDTAGDREFDAQRNRAAVLRFAALASTPTGCCFCGCLALRKRGLGTRQLVIATRCERCRVAQYCGADCEASDWQHRLICDSLASEAAVSGRSVLGSEFSD